MKKYFIALFGTQNEIQKHSSSTSKKPKIGLWIWRRRSELEPVSSRTGERILRICLAASIKWNIHLNMLRRDIEEEIYGPSAATDQVDSNAIFYRQL
jgi:hypothetical protein